MEAEIKIPGCYWGKSFGKRYLVISIFSIKHAFTLNLQSTVYQVFIIFSRILRKINQQIFHLKYRN